MQNTRYKYLLSPRCGAKTRQQTTCMAPAVRGNRRCRMHGGKGSGAPKGSQNALKTGLHTREAISGRREVRAVISRWKAFQEESLKVT